MRFSWDPGKAKANLAKHGVSFERAAELWSDPSREIVLDQIVDGETRWRAIGRAGWLTLLVVVHIYPERDDEEHVRIISARKATPLERKRHDQRK